MGYYYNQRGKDWDTDRVISGTVAEFYTWENGYDYDGII